MLLKATFFINKQRWLMYFVLLFICYMPLFNRGSHLRMCIIILTFGDKKEPRSLQIIRME